MFVIKKMLRLVFKHFFKEKHKNKIIPKLYCFSKWWNDKKNN